MGFLFGECSLCCATCDVGGADETQPAVTVVDTDCECHAPHVPIEVPFYAYLADGIGQPAYRAPPIGNGQAARCRGWEWRTSVGQITETDIAACKCEEGWPITGIQFPTGIEYIDIGFLIGVRCCPRDEHNNGSYSGTGGLLWSSGPRGISSNNFCDTREMSGIEVTISPRHYAEVEQAGLLSCSVVSAAACGIANADLEVIDGVLTGTVTANADGCTVDLEFGNPLP